MLKNYFTIALRLLIKQRIYAVINIFGLAVGIAFCLLLLLYVQDELTFDSDHENGDRIVRLINVRYSPDGGVSSAHPYIAYPVGKALEEEVTSVEAVTRIMRRPAFVRTDVGTTEQEVLFADPSLLTTFSFPLIQGDPEFALPEPEGLVISKRMAEKYFPDESPVGKMIDIRFDDVFKSVTVTGVAENSPSNSSIRFDFLMPFERLAMEYEWIAGNKDQWFASSFHVYGLLHAGTELEVAQQQVTEFYRKYHSDNLEGARQNGNWTADHDPAGFRLQPLPEIHLDTTVSPGLTPASDPRYSWVLAGIAFVILLLACINFTTLAIGRSASRTREIGLRKVVGAARAQLAGQFGGEALLTSGIALVVGVFSAFVLLPTFNDLAGKELVFAQDGHLTLILGLVALLLLVALLSGFYPALVLSRYRPTDMLRKQSRIGGSTRLTGLLVMVQFTLSVALIAGTVIMNRQMSFLRTADIGYDRDHVVLVNSQNQDGERLLQHFRTTLEERSEFDGITGMTNAFSHGWSQNGWQYKGEQKQAYVYRVESDFIDVMDIDIIDGRNFDPELGTDSMAVIINQAFVKDFDIQDPVGSLLDGYSDNAVIIGVMRDFNFRSLHNAVEPAMLIMDPNWSIGDVLFQVNPAQVSDAVSLIDNEWRAFAPDIPFTYSFLDEDLGKQYESEQQWTRIVRYASFFAILIAALGLFGLASLAVTSRTKEIGIRRVLGASTLGITRQLSGSFVRLVLVGVILAVPITWIFANRWLDTFAYRIDINVFVFVIAAMLAVGVAIFTVGVQTLRAASMNPVDSIRVE